MLPSFAPVSSWEEGADLIGFIPRTPRETLGFPVDSMHVFVRDHKQREVPVSERSLEVYYRLKNDGPGFVLSQSCPGTPEAERRAFQRSYGQDGRPTRVAGKPARLYPLGPPVAEDDVDGRPPAVIVWQDDDRLMLIASSTLEVDQLQRVADSLYG
ncbi:hypothetical protein ABI59_11540 [Acidobacteria bacterium Mor1]|nr:hypothetical protein ABI59_11540 [Acidobacteria bacterium Mor1]